MCYYYYYDYYYFFCPLLSIAPHHKELIQDKNKPSASLGLNRTHYFSKYSVLNPALRGMTF